MEILIYTGPNGHKATLTTDSPASSYGIPALRIEGPGFDDMPDFGPGGMLPSGITAHELVWSWAEGVSFDGDAGTWAPITHEGRAAARAFCAQNPFGPEVSRDRILMNPHTGTVQVEVKS